VFRVTTNGAISTLVNFANTNGAYPKTGLVVGGDGNYYGTTYFGGNLSLNSGSGYGTIYKLVLPATAALWITNPMVSNRVFSATVTGSASASIQIQYTTNLPPAWNTLTNLVFTTGSAQFTDTTTNSHRFYRAVQ
jgi:hypothetical protein